MTWTLDLTFLPPDGASIFEKWWKLVENLGARIFTYFYLHENHEFKPFMQVNTTVPWSIP